VAQTVIIGEQKVESESLKFSATPTPQVENPSDSSTPTPQPWFVDPTSPESNSKVLLKLCMKILTTRCALEIVSLAPRVDLESKQKHAFVSE